MYKFLCRYRVQDSFSYFWLTLVSENKYTQQNKREKKKEKKRNAYDMACKLQPSI